MTTRQQKAGARLWRSSSAWPWLLQDAAAVPRIERQRASEHRTNARTLGQELGQLRRHHRVLEAGARVASPAGQLQQRRVHGARPQA